MDDCLGVDGVKYFKGRFSDIQPACRLAGCTWLQTDEMTVQDKNNWIHFITGWLKDGTGF
jgi:hypothetical protein